MKRIVINFTILVLFPPTDVPENIIELASMCISRYFLWLSGSLGFSPPEVPKMMDHLDVTTKMASMSMSRYFARLSGSLGFSPPEVLKMMITNPFPMLSRTAPLGTTVAQSTTQRM